MADFDDLIEAQLAGHTPQAAPLVHFDFRSQAMRVWPGFGDLAAGGATWSGIGNAGAISQVTAGSSGAVEEMTFSLFGDERILAHLDEDGAESSGREVNVWYQFFDMRRQDESGRWVQWQPLGAPIQVFWGIMGPLMTQMSPPEGDGPRRRVISVRAQSAFVNRARPRFAYFSDRDQKSRDPTGTDNIFIRTPQYAEGTVRWPQF